MATANLFSNVKSYNLKYLLQLEYATSMDINLSGLTPDISRITLECLIRDYKKHIRLGKSEISNSLYSNDLIITENNYIKDEYGILIGKDLLLNLTLILYVLYNFEKTAQIHFNQAIDLSKPFHQTKYLSKILVSPINLNAEYPSDIMNPYAVKRLKNTPVIKKIENLLFSITGLIGMANVFQSTFYIKDFASFINFLEEKLMFNVLIFKQNNQSESIKKSLSVDVIKKYVP